jgi:hypothetical protein
VERIEHKSPSRQTASVGAFITRSG